MQTLHIGISRKGRYLSIALALWLAAMLGLTNLVWWAQAGAQLALLIAWVFAYCRSYGISKTLRLEIKDGHWRVSGPKLAEQSVRAIRRGLTNPGLATLQLRLERGWISLLVFDDAVSKEEHWQLRRLMIDGLPAAKLKAGA